MGSEEIVHEVAERVRAIVADAEQRAAQIVREAEQEAERIRAGAEEESTRRLEEVRAALDEFQGRLGGSAVGARAEAEVEPGPVVVPEPEPPATPEPGPEPVPEPSPDPAPQPEPPTIPEPTPPPDEGTPPTPGSNGGDAAKSADAAAARLVAMNMALDGAPRAEIERHLADNYQLEDAGVIVDDVLALAAK